jgi:hypothetical protein
MESRRILSRLPILLLPFAVLTFILLSCGGSDTADNGQHGSIALYLTDSMSDFQQVTATINAVQVRSTGTGASCSVLSEPLVVDITELANILQLVSIADCPAGSYNRLHIEFEQTVSLMDAAGSASSCSFTSYKDDHARPNALHCDPASGICSLDVTGAVNVLADRPTPVGLDFDLKNFEVQDLGNPETCAVTMKVSPIHADGIGKISHVRGLSGRITQLDTDARTFLLTKGHRTFFVDYSSITATLQPGIDLLLLRAQTDELAVKVLSTEIDLVSSTLSAKAVYIKAEGTVSGLDSGAQTFTLTYRTAKEMTVFYGPPARVEGAIDENAWVEVKLYGHDSVNDRFLAIHVEREFDESQHGKLNED